MPNWYSKDLGDGVDAYAPTLQIKKTFATMFTKAGQPNDMAIFTRYDLKTNVFTIYFSPQTAELAIEFSATPCDKPEFNDGLSLLAGRLRSTQSLFQE